mgnify:CR=1 FL=1
MAATRNVEGTGTITIQDYENKDDAKEEVIDPFWKNLFAFYSFLEMSIDVGKDRERERTIIIELRVRQKRSFSECNRYLTRHYIYIYVCICILLHLYYLLDRGVKALGQIDIKLYTLQQLLVMYVWGGWGMNSTFNIISLQWDDKSSSRKESWYTISN